MYSGEVTKDIARVTIAENKPRLALIGKSKVRFDTNVFGRQ